MRRKDREIPKNDAIEILRKGEFGVLSMSTQKNEGYGIPLNFVLSGNDIYFHCALDGYKLECLKKNSKVSFCVVGKSAEVIPSQFAMVYESAMAFGRLTEVEEGKEEVLLQFLNKYSQNNILEGTKYISANIHRVRILKLSITSITGKSRKI